MAILISVLVLGALGRVFGFMLMIANKVFEMPSDPKRDAIRNALPGATAAVVVLLAVMRWLMLLLQAMHLSAPAPLAA